MNILKIINNVFFGKRLDQSFTIQHDYEVDYSRIKVNKKTGSISVK